MLVEVNKELESVFPVYLRNRQEDLMNLEASLGRMDFTVLKNIGHKVAGNAGSYGLKELERYAQELENQAKERNFDECSRIVEGMKNYLKSLEPKFV